MKKKKEAERVFFFFSFLLPAIARQVFPSSKSSLSLSLQSTLDIGRSRAPASSISLVDEGGETRRLFPRARAAAE